MALPLTIPPVMLARLRPQHRPARLAPPPTWPLHRARTAAPLHQRLLPRVAEQARGRACAARSRLGLHRPRPPAGLERPLQSSTHLKAAQVVLGAAFDLCVPCPAIVRLPCRRPVKQRRPLMPCSRLSPALPPPRLSGCLRQPGCRRLYRQQPQRLCMQQSHGSGPGRRMLQPSPELGRCSSSPRLWHGSTRSLRTPQSSATSPRAQTGSSLPAARWRSRG